MMALRPRLGRHALSAFACILLAGCTAAGPELDCVRFPAFRDSAVLSDDARSLRRRAMLREARVLAGPLSGTLVEVTRGYLELGDLAEAWAVAASITRSNYRAEAFVSIAEYTASQGDLERTRAAAEETRGVRSNRPTLRGHDDALRYLATAYAQSGDSESAFAALDAGSWFRTRVSDVVHVARGLALGGHFEAARRLHASIGPEERLTALGLEVDFAGGRLARGDAVQGTRDLEKVLAALNGLRLSDRLHLTARVAAAFRDGRAPDVAAGVLQRARRWISALPDDQALYGLMRLRRFHEEIGDEAGRADSTTVLVARLKAALSGGAPADTGLLERDSAYGPLGGRPNAEIAARLLAENDEMHHAERLAGAAQEDWEGLRIRAAMAGGLAARGDLPRALDLARSLDDREARCAALSRIATALADRREVAMALDVAEQIEDDVCLRYGGALPRPLSRFFVTPQPFAKIAVIAARLDEAGVACRALDGIGDGELRDIILFHVAVIRAEQDDFDTAIALFARDEASRASILARAVTLRPPSWIYYGVERDAQALGSAKTP